MRQKGQNNQPNAKTIIFIYVLLYYYVHFIKTFKWNNFFIHKLVSRHTGGRKTKKKLVPYVLECFFD